MMFRVFFTVHYPTHRFEDYVEVRADSPTAAVLAAMDLAEDAYDYPVRNFQPLEM
jgi:hypothetical protein